MGPEPIGIYRPGSAHIDALAGEHIWPMDLVYMGKNGKYYRCWTARPGVWYYERRNLADRIFRAIGRVLGSE